MQNLKKKTNKTLLIQFRLFIFYKPACLQKYFHGRVLSIRVFSSDGHYGLTVGTFRLDYEYEIEYEYDLRFSNQRRFQSPKFFMLVLGREGSSWDEMGMCCDNVKPEN